MKDLEGQRRRLVWRACRLATLCPLAAIENLKSHLAPSGTLVATCPLGYNGVLDRLLTNESGEFTELSYLKRMSVSNQWVEVGWPAVQGAQYGRPFPYANALAIATYHACAENRALPSPPRHK